ncbi:MAG: response regulator [Deltaproteobacteria bacterium]|nr:response regulator [Deltaproteobacteria bacterium]
MKSKILLVDDEENILKQMRWALEPDYEVFTTSDEGEAMTIFEQEKPPVVTLDLSLNPQNPADLGGMRLLDQMLSMAPVTRAIVITGNSDDVNAMNAVRLGALDYYAKPIRLEELKVMISRKITTQTTGGYLT